MVKSIGIDPGDRAVKVVELDGSYRKTRLVRVHSAPVASAADDLLRPDAVADVVRAAFDLGMRGDVTLGHPCREAVLRNLELPFKGHDAIKKVVKSEIEGEIYTHAVDDMVVDFHEIGPGAAGGTRVMVASVPKAGLRNQLTSLSAQGIEPEFVDLDTMALWRVAHWAGAFAADADADAAPSGDASTKPVRAVVDVGARSVKIILVEGEQLVDMRAMRLGDAAVAEHVARHYGIPYEEARGAVSECLLAGTDTTVDVAVLPSPAADAAAPVADGPAAPGAGEMRAVTVTHQEVDAAQTAFLQRLARELTRFLTASGLAPRIRGVWVTGGACRSPGLVEMLAAAFGTEVRELDVLGRLQHDLDPAEADALGPTLATAVGLALGRLGGPEGLQLRQEDLALMRGFERIKFPLAIACMVALLALFVHANRRSIELKSLHLHIGQQHIDPARPRAAIFHGLLNPLFEKKWFEDENYFSMARGNKSYAFKDLFEEVASAPMHKRVQIIRDRLRAVADQKQKESGVYEDVSIESGLAALVRWATIVKSVEPQLGRFLVTRLDLDMKAPNRKLEFTIAFRGEDFRTRMAMLDRAIKADIEKADSPFEPPRRSGDDVRELPFSNSEEAQVAGAYFRVLIAIKDSFPPFGDDGTLGAAGPGGTNDVARARGGALAGAAAQPEGGR